ncbi:MAG TPA: hypothetical protein VGH83_02960 [Candidatus Acidoferrum sp.]
MKAALGTRLSLREKLSPTAATGSVGLAIGHFLDHVQNQLAVFFLDFAEKTAKLIQETGFFPHAAPRDIVRRFTLGQVGKLGWLFSIIEELVEWALESTSQLFQRFDGRNGMAIFNAGDITTKQASSLFDVALGEFLFLAHYTEAVANNHGGIIPLSK